MFAALGAGLAGGQELDVALRLAMAQDASTPPGTVSAAARAEQIQQLSRHIAVQELDRCPRRHERRVDP